MTTKEAFEQLINQRGWYKKVEGVTPENGRNIRRYFKEGTITIDKMEAILIKAGFTVIQEKLWATN